jgi:hypothetical protein
MARDRSGIVLGTWEDLVFQEGQGGCDLSILQLIVEGGPVNGREILVEVFSLNLFLRLAPYQTLAGGGSVLCRVGSPAVQDILPCDGHNTREVLQERLG